MDETWVELQHHPNKKARPDFSERANKQEIKSRSYSVAALLAAGFSYVSTRLMRAALPLRARR